MLLIRGGSLFIVGEKGEEEFESPFASEKMAADLKHSTKHAWKGAPGASEDPALIPRTMLWGGGGKGGPANKPMIQFCQKVNERLYYVLKMPNSSGLFYYDQASAKEIRLFHREHFDPHGIFVTTDYSIYTTRQDETGAVPLVKLDEKGNLTHQITLGDCIDEYPFICGDELYYQSTGLARTPEGFIAAHAPAVANRLNLKTGVVETLAGHEQFDFLLPKTDGKGNVYYIRRSREVVGRVPVSTIIWDILAFPFRFLSALLGFLNVFSAMFGKKPLITAGGPETPQIDVSKQIILGRWVDTAAVMKKEGRQTAVPGDWELIRRLPSGIEERIATHVAWYDLNDQGCPTYTDGFNIYQGSSVPIRKSPELIQRLYA